MVSHHVTRKQYVLRIGDLDYLAAQTGRDKSHISRVISGERQSKSLAAQIETLLGYKLAELVLPRDGRRVA